MAKYRYYVALCRGSTRENPANLFRIPDGLESKAESLTRQHGWSLASQPREAYGDPDDFPEVSEAEAQQIYAKLTGSG